MKVATLITWKIPMVTLRRALSKNTSYLVFLIQRFLSMYHGIELSLRQLHRNLRHLGMFCRKNSDDINTIIIAIKREADTSSSVMDTE